MTITTREPIQMSVRYLPAPVQRAIRKALTVAHVPHEEYEAALAGRFCDLDNWIDLSLIEKELTEGTYVYGYYTVGKNEAVPVTSETRLQNGMVREFSKCLNHRAVIHTPIQRTDGGYEVVLHLLPSNTPVLDYRAANAYSEPSNVEGELVVLEPHYTHYHNFFMVELRHLEAGVMQSEDDFLQSLFMALPLEQQTYLAREQIAVDIFHSPKDSMCQLRDFKEEYLIKFTVPPIVGSVIPAAEFEAFLKNTLR